MRHPIRNALRALVPAAALFLSLLGAGGALAQSTSTRASAESTDPDMSDDDADSTGPKEFRFELSFIGGYWIVNPHSSLLPDADDPTELSPRSGFAPGLRLTMNFNPWVGLEGEALTSFSKPRGADVPDIALTLWNLRLNLILNCASCYPFRPFMLLGVGGVGTFRDKPDITYKGTTYEYDAGDESVHAGIGFKIFFNERVGVRFDGVVLAPPVCPFPFAKLSTESVCTGPEWQLLASFFFNFSEVPKSTKKFVYKKEVVMVQPPAPPPPPPPPPPPADPDGDGIAGTADKCPEQAEDRDGFQDEDGCPDPDNDADGILDAQDKCPMQPESRNGIDDEDGCPEEDTDGDGFIGSRDKCPDAPETKNNFKDDDGCPDEIPQEVKKFTGVIEGINFKTGSADILPGSYAILDRAVAVLKEYTDIKMEVSGHTDNRGSADYNHSLSQRRAEAVRQYFVLKGVSPERLTAVGFGFDKPIADNDTEFGRSKNRRTEFKLIGAP